MQRMYEKDLQSFKIKMTSYEQIEESPQSESTTKHQHSTLQRSTESFI